MLNVLNFPEQNGCAEQENYNRNDWAQKHNKPGLRDDIVGVVAVDRVAGSEGEANGKLKCNQFNRRVEIAT